MRLRKNMTQEIQKCIWRENDARQKQEGVKNIFRNQSQRLTDFWKQENLIPNENIWSNQNVALLMIAENNMEKSCDKWECFKWLQKKKKTVNKNQKKKAENSGRRNEERRLEEFNTHWTQQWKAKESSQQPTSCKYI